MEVRQPAPSLAEADNVLALMRSTINPSTGEPFDAMTSTANTQYIAAALAVQRDLCAKPNGTPNYTAAARMYGGDRINAASGTSVKANAIQRNRIRNA